MMSSGRRAVFLDRDGTINVEKNYLYRPEEFMFIPGVPDAIRRLNEAGFLVVVVTNQSGVARGYFNTDAVARLHEHLQERLRRDGAHVDAFYTCPHHPTAGIGSYRTECDCRKGRPGMLLEAARDLRIDLARSYMVGDKKADIEAGERAGCTAILVLTGYGAQEAGQNNDALVFPALPAAVDFIIAQTDFGGICS